MQEREGLHILWTYKLLNNNYAAFQDIISTPAGFRHNYVYDRKGSWLYSHILEKCC